MKKLVKTYLRKEEHETTTSADEDDCLNRLFDANHSLRLGIRVVFGTLKMRRPEGSPEAKSARSMFGTSQAQITFVLGRNLHFRARNRPVFVHWNP